MRIFVTHEVEQAEKNQFITAFYRQKRVPVQYRAVFVPITEVFLIEVGQMYQILLWLLWGWGLLGSYYLAVI